jgi:hypothetical protein
VLARRARSLLAVGLAAAAAQAACGGGDEGPTPSDRVRDATSAYLGALENSRWARACALLTSGARRELEEARGSCVRALMGGAALPADQLASAYREVAGATVRIHGRRAAIGPLGDFPQPLRLESVRGRWLIDG